MARGQRSHRCRSRYHHLCQSVYPHQRAATGSGGPQPSRSARPRVIPESSTAGSPYCAGRREHEPSQLWTRNANAGVVCLGAGDDDHDARRRAHALSTARAGTNPYVFSISQSPRSCNDISPPVASATETLDDLTATERAARTHPDAPPRLPPLPFTDHAEEMSRILFAPELIAPPPIVWLPSDRSGVARAEARDLELFHDLRAVIEVRSNDDVMLRRHHHHQHSGGS